MSIVKLQLTFDVSLDLSNVPAEEIEMAIDRVQNNLSSVAYRGIEEGMITDDCDAEIDDYKINVEEIVDNQHNPRAKPGKG